MAAVNFPNNPSVNDTHTSSGSTWKWDGTVWQRLGVAGPQGAQGVQGAAGSGGAAGAQGAQGRQGAAGSNGAAGAQGAQGHQGVQGAANATTISNNANNKVITGSDSANVLRAESDFTWDNSTSILSVGNQLVRIGSGNAGQNSGSRSTTVGNYCGQSSGGYSVNVGGNAVGNSAGGYSVNVGGNSVGSSAGQYSINIGGNAVGYSNASQYSINIGGQYTGYSNAGEHCINIGYSAGYQSGGKYGVNIGYNAGNMHSVNSSHNVAIGYEALKHEGSNKYCIGIGASCYLPIKGESTGASDNQLVIGVGHTAWIVGTKNYNVGFGITNPGAIVHAYHATSNTIAQFESGDAGANTIWKDNSTYSSIEQNGTDFIISADQGASHASSALSFKVDTSEKLRIASDGKIGINNNGPLYEMHFKNAMGSNPSWIHMEVTGSNAIGGGGGIAFDTSASNNATNNSLYLATVKGIRNSSDDGSNDLVFSTSMSGVVGDDGNTHSPKEKLRINSHGRVLIGHSSARVASSTVNSFLQLEGTDHHAGISVIRNTNSAYGPYFVLGKSRSSSVGGYTILQDNDHIGSIRFAGADGTDMVQYGGEIRVEVNGTPAANSMPSDMVFQTNTGSGNPTEKLRITNNGHVRVPDDGKFICGGGSDIKYYHSGGTNYCDISSGQQLYFRVNGANKFYVQSGGAQFVGNLYADDNNKIELGNDQDLKIYHDSSHSYMDHSGAGNLYIRTLGTDENLIVQAQHDVFIKCSNGESGIEAYGDAGVHLYYNNSQRLYTSNAGSVCKRQSGGATEFDVIGCEGNDARIRLLSDDGDDNADYWRINAAHVGNLFTIESYAGGSWQKVFRGTDGRSAELYYQDGLKLSTKSFGVQIEMTPRMDLYGTGNNIELKFITNSGTHRGSVYADNGNTIGFLKAGTGAWAARWHSDGKQTAHGHISPNANDTYDLGGTSTGMNRWRTAYTVNSLNTSDRNLKNTIVESDLGLSFINKLKPVSYKWNSQNLGTKTHYGLIAQDVEEVIINEGKTLNDFGAVDKPDGNDMGLAYNEFISPLIKAVQELSAENTELKAILDALKAKVAALESS